MALIVKVSWLSMLMFFILFIVTVFPSNAALFISMFAIGGLMYWLVMSILKDGEQVGPASEIPE